MTGYKDKWYNTDTLDEMIKICTYLKDSSVREVKTTNKEIAKFFEDIGYEVKNHYISRKQEEVEDLGYW